MRVQCATPKRHKSEKKRHFLALCNSKPPVVGIQIHIFKYPNTHTILVQRYACSVCHTERTYFLAWCILRAPTLGPLLLVFMVQRCRLSARHTKPTYFNMVHFKHTLTRYPKTLLMALLVPWLPQKRNSGRREPSHNPCTIFAP